MTGQDIQDKLDALVEDLQEKGAGKTINIMFRNPDNTPNILPLSSDANGVVNAGQLAAVQNFLTDIIDEANFYEAQLPAVRTAGENFKDAREPHTALFESAKTARETLSAALEADAVYQAAKTALNQARTDPDYVAAKTAYENHNTTENYNALVNARGEYVV